MKNGQLIAVFNHNGRTFELIYENGIRCVSYDESGQRCFNFSKEEMSIIIGIVHSLKIDLKNSEYVRSDYVNDRLYKIYYDSKSNNYFWESSDGINYSEDNVILNVRYNHIPEYVCFYNRTYEDRLDKKLKKYYKKGYIEELNRIYNYGERIHRKEICIRVGKRRRFKNLMVNSTLNLLLLSSIPFMLHMYVSSMESMYGEDWKDYFPKFSVVESTSTEYSEPNNYTEPGVLEDVTEVVIEVPEVTEVVEEEYGWEKIKSAIENNPNFSDIEKKFISELKFVFDENHKYMDLDMIISRLETLKIVYNEGPCPDDINIGGYFRRNSNLIEIYNCTSFDDAKIDVFIHEFFHVLQCPSSAQLTTELSNEMFTRETLRRLHVDGILDKYKVDIKLSSLGIYQYGVGYDDWLWMYYSLAELVPRTTLCKYQFQCNEGILTNGLCSKGNDFSDQSFKKAWELIDLINDGTDEYTLLLGLPPEYVDEVQRNMNYFFKLRDTSIEQNANIMANQLSFRTSCTKGEFLLKSLGKLHYLEFDENIGLFVSSQMKTYFSNAVPETVIYLTFDSKGSDRDYGQQILKDNGDYNVTYTISIDETISNDYSDFVLEQNRSISK